ncbi:MAG: hypothetical protein NTZ87_02705 [Candidatus Nomurabacteria bacterium]|nr:hypothetical protein [Candidatus Nomurabacteria bacterium]
MPIGLQETRIDNIRQTTWGYIRKHYLMQAVGLSVLFIIGIPLFPLAFFVIALGIMLYFYVRRKVRSEFIKQIGISMGFTYSSTAPPVGVGGKLFSLGHNPKLTDVLSGQYRSIPLRLLTYSYICGEGRNACNYAFSVLEVTFQSSMPEILLFSKINIAKMPPDIFSISKPLKLEGDFNNYFYLFVTKGYEMETLELLTPDVMTNLIDIDKTSKSSLEFFGDKMYIYITKPINSKSDIQNIFSLADFFIDLFKHNASEIHVNPSPVQH